MKHVNEELPDVQQRRPEVSAAAALVVERATAKDPKNRYQDIEELIDDLSTALEVEAARAGSTTGEATSVLEALPPAKRKLSSRARWSWAAIVLLVLVGGGALVATQLIGNGQSPVGGGGGALDGKGNSVEIVSATDFDPKGDGEENPEAIEFAVDGNPSTAWTSEHYDTEEFAGTKSEPNPGVGFYVTTEQVAKPSRMIVQGSPGWDAQIYAADAGPPPELEEWGEPVATVTNASETQEIPLDVESPAFYFLLWFTKAGPSTEQDGRFRIEISDVKLTE
jgi:serine/threonine-protein kinase